VRTRPRTSPSRRAARARTSLRGWRRSAPRHDGSASGPPTAPDGSPRRCWRPDKGDPKVPGSDQRFWQGDIGTHGLHLLFLAESDNARQTVPLTEIVSSWQMVMLKGQQDSTAGEKYGRSFEKPLVTAVLPYSGTPDTSAKAKARSKRRAR